MFTEIFARGQMGKTKFKTEQSRKRRQMYVIDQTRACQRRRKSTVRLPRVTESINETFRRQYQLVRTVGLSLLFSRKVYSIYIYHILLQIGMCGDRAFINGSVVVVRAET